MSKDHSPNEDATTRNLKKIYIKRLKQREQIPSPYSPPVGFAAAGLKLLLRFRLETLGAVDTFCDDDEVCIPILHTLDLGAKRKKRALFGFLLGEQSVTNDVSCYQVEYQEGWESFGESWPGGRFACFLKFAGMRVVEFSPKIDQVSISYVFQITGTTSAKQSTS